MLKKCLKYDLRAIWKYWWLIALTTLGLSVVCGASIRGIVFSVTDPEVLEYSFIIVIPLYLMAVMCIFGLIASVTVTMIFIFIRFYKNFFSDEGYLTFTLPVKRSTLFASKVISGSVFYVGHSVLLVLCVLIILAIGVPWDAWVSLFEGWPKPDMAFAQAISTLITTVITLIAYFVLSTLVLVFEILLVYFCITVGAVIAKKGKVFAGIGIYYGVNFVISFTVQIFVAIFGSLLIEGAMTILGGAPVWQSHATIVLAAVLLCVIVAVPVCLLYILTLNLIERKLNLS